MLNSAVIRHGDVMNSHDASHKNCFTVTFLRFRFLVFIKLEFDYKFGGYFLDCSFKTAKVMAHHTNAWFCSWPFHVEHESMRNYIVCT
jgi:hypothetical protein